MRSRPSLPPEGSVDVEIRVIARARRDEVGAERAGRLLVRTPANPIDDQANEAVCRSLARYFGVPRRHVELLSGHRARDKTVRIQGATRQWPLAKAAAASRPST